MPSESRREILKRQIREYAAERQSYPDKSDFPGISDGAHKVMVEKHRGRCDHLWLTLIETIERYIPPTKTEREAAKPRAHIFTGVKPEGKS